MHLFENRVYTQYSPQLLSNSETVSHNENRSRERMSLKSTKPVINMELTLDPSRIGTISAGPLVYFKGGRGGCSNHAFIFRGFVL